MDPLIHDLKRIRRRLLLVRAAEAGLEGAVAAGVFAIFLTALRVFLPHSLPLLATHPGWPATLVPLGFAAMALWRLMRGVTLREAAIEADRAANLKERLSTAYEVLLKAKQGVRSLNSLRLLTPSGLLDDRLVAQAREAASAIEAAHLPIARSFNRRLRNLLAAVVLVLAGGFVPSVGGPLLPPGASERAAARIQEVAGSKAIAPAIRNAVETALVQLQAPAASKGDAQEATAAVYAAIQKAAQDRQAAGRVLAKIASPDIQKMIRAAQGGSAGTASAAAESLAGKVGAEPGAGGMPLEDRERLADALSGAAIEAKKAALLPLAAGLDRAAGAVKRPDAAAAGEAMQGLAAAMTEALGQPGAGGVPALVSAVRDIRRELGLPDLPPGDLPGEVAPAGTVGVVPPVVGETPAAHPETGTVGTGAAAPSIPADVKPEDRDVVRRYFGG